MHDFYHELQHVCLRLAKRGRGRRRVRRGGAAGTGWRNRREETETPDVIIPDGFADVGEEDAEGGAAYDFTGFTAAKTFAMSASVKKLNWGARSLPRAAA